MEKPRSMLDECGGRGKKGRGGGGICPTIFGPTLLCCFSISIDKMSEQWNKALYTESVIFLHLCKFIV